MNSLELTLKYNLLSLVSDVAPGVVAVGVVGACGGCAWV